MKFQGATFSQLLDEAKTAGPIRIAVPNAAQGLVIETLREAQRHGLVEPRLIDAPDAIATVARELGWKLKDEWIVAAPEASAASKAVELARSGQADAVMKGHLHTDAFMRALLDRDLGLRLPGRRASHVFVAQVPSYPRLLGVTDAAINIAPDLNAKAEILRNAVELFALLGVSRPRVAVLSAVETVNPMIASTIDAASLALMARRSQIDGAIVDGPLAFDNAVSLRAAREKGIASEVAGNADIVLVPDLVSGNILVKNLVYLGGATAAGIVVGLRVPVVLTSRADPPTGRLASLALAVLAHHRMPKTPAQPEGSEGSLHCAPQPEHACCPLLT